MACATRPAAAPTNPEVAEEKAHPQDDIDVRTLAKLTAACESTEDPVAAASACFALGGISDEDDRFGDRAIALLLTGCERGDADACAVFGGLLVRDLDDLPPQSAKAKRRAALAIKMLTRACRASHPIACATIGHLHEKRHWGTGGSRTSAELLSGCVSTA